MGVNQIFSPETKPGQIKVASGQVALDGTGETSVQTGLQQILDAVVTIKSTDESGLGGTVVFSWNVADATPGQLDIYPWMMSTADPTLAASSGTETVSWIAIGY